MSVHWQAAEQVVAAQPQVQQAVNWEESGLEQVDAINLKHAGALAPQEQTGSENARLHLHALICGVI